MWEVPGSDVFPEITYPEELFHDFPQSLRSVTGQYLKLAMTTYIHILSSWLVILPCSFNLYSVIYWHHLCIRHIHNVTTSGITELSDVPLKLSATSECSEEIDVCRSNIPKSGVWQICFLSRWQPKNFVTLISCFLLWIYVVTIRKVIPSIISVTRIMCVFSYDIHTQWGYSSRMMPVFVIIVSHTPWKAYKTKSQNENSLKIH